jgi:cob(I)alamin adenosyltransferase
MDTGLIQVYCGEGKGKTTAAIGLGVRAIGSHLKVIMIQFLKNDDTGECRTLKRLEPQFKVFHFEKHRDFTWNLSDEEKEDLKIDIQTALKFARKVMDTGECDVLILDEILGAIAENLVPEEDVLALLTDKAQEIEIVLTGRKVPERLAALADYISEIHPNKHPMDKGIAARQGIEF